jgi:hypothetical protein
VLRRSGCRRACAFTGAAAGRARAAAQQLAAARREKLMRRVPHFASVGCRLRDPHPPRSVGFFFLTRTSIGRLLDNKSIASEANFKTFLRSVIFLVDGDITLAPLVHEFFLKKLPRGFAFAGFCFHSVGI